MSHISLLLSSGDWKKFFRHVVYGVCFCLFCSKRVNCLVFALQGQLDVLYGGERRFMHGYNMYCNEIAEGYEEAGKLLMFFNRL